MKQYVIDDIREPEMRRLQAWCGENLAKSCFADVFWLYLDEAVLSDIQLAHTECHPLYFSVTLEAEAGRLVIDMAVRTAHSMHCACMDFIDLRQFAWLDNYINSLFAELDIRI